MFGSGHPPLSHGAGAEGSPRPRAAPARYFSRRGSVGLSSPGKAAGPGSSAWTMRAPLADDPGRSLVETERAGALSR
jgi:hypothetical protein